MNEPNFDRLAPWYRTLERISFGPYLQWCRTVHLPRLLEARAVLILGDGDGRFLEAFLKRNPHAKVESWDISPAMLDLAKRRIAAIPGGLERVAFHQADVRTVAFPARAYDLIVTNFVLDCFPKAELERLIFKLSGTLTPHGQWLVGDFATPRTRFTRSIARVALWAMYRFFQTVTKLPTNELTNPEPLLTQHGLRRTQTQTRLNGFLNSTLWTKFRTATPAETA